MSHTTADRLLDQTQAERVKVDAQLEAWTAEERTLTAQQTADAAAMKRLAFNALADPASEASRQLQQLTARAGEVAARLVALAAAKAGGQQRLAELDRQMTSLRHLKEALAAAARTPTQRELFERCGSAAETLGEALRVLKREGLLDYQALVAILSTGDPGGLIQETGLPNRRMHHAGPGGALEHFDRVLGTPRADRVAHLESVIADGPGATMRVRMLRSIILRQPGPDGHQHRRIAGEGELVVVSKAKGEQLVDDGLAESDIDDLLVHEQDGWDASGVATRFTPTIPQTSPPRSRVQAKSVEA